MAEETKKIAGKYNQGRGRRKEASARIRLYKGTGELIINDKTGLEYFNGSTYFPNLIFSPLVLTGTKSKYDVVVKISGGGKKGQAEAIRLGIARALIKEDENLKKTLKSAGFLTRDFKVFFKFSSSLIRARKAPQFSKR
ncbi:30S ribosomal protein S9 [Patescibacteria group bacterium]|nr:30S ribosomal protein S9 [Patescibacteria group bacterium]